MIDRPRSSIPGWAQTEALMRLSTLDRILLVLVFGIGGTGLLALAGSETADWVFTLHGLLGGALLVATLIKGRQSIPPALGKGRQGPVALSLFVALAIGGALVGGFVWVASGRLLTVGPGPSSRSTHGSGSCSCPSSSCTCCHGDGAPSDRARPRYLRRTVLVAGGLAAVSVGAFLGSTTLDRFLGGVRRFTRVALAHARLDPAGDDLLRRACAIDRPRLLAAHRRRSSHRHRRAASARRDRDDSRARLHFGLGGRDDLARCPADVHPRYPGPRECPRPGATGWSTVLSADQARTAILATGVAGTDLPAANGAPCRLVVGPPRPRLGQMGRRGVTRLIRPAETAPRERTIESP